MESVTEQAFIRAYDDYADELFRFCAFQARDREHARDLMQDAFLRTWTYLAQGGEVQNLRAFLYKVARNLAINEAVRSKTLSLEALQEAGGYDPADEAVATPEDAAEAALLRQHLKELPPETQELLTLRYMNGLPVKEVAEILDLAPNAVSVRIHRALADLRERMHA